eukprot:3623759-Rhodomonas_salina.1
MVSGPVQDVRQERRGEFCRCAAGSVLATAHDAVPDATAFLSAATLPGSRAADELPERAAAGAGVQRGATDAAGARAAGQPGTGSGPVAQRQDLWPRRPVQPGCDWHEHVRALE